MSLMAIGAVLALEFCNGFGGGFVNGDGLALVGDEQKDEQHCKQYYAQPEKSALFSLVVHPVFRSTRWCLAGGISVD